MFVTSQRAEIQSKHFVECRASGRSRGQTPHADSIGDTKQRTAEFCKHAAFKWIDWLSSWSITLFCFSFSHHCDSFLFGRGANRRAFYPPAGGGCVPTTVCQVQEFQKVLETLPWKEFLIIFNKNKTNNCRSAFQNEGTKKPVKSQKFWVGKVSCKHHLASTKTSPWRFSVQTTRLGRHQHCYDIRFHIHSHYNVHCTFCCKHICSDSPPEFHKPLRALISGHFSHLAKFSCKQKSFVSTTLAS